MVCAIVLRYTALHCVVLAVSCQTGRAQRDGASPIIGSFVPERRTIRCIWFLSCLLLVANANGVGNPDLLCPCSHLFSPVSVSCGMGVSLPLLSVMWRAPSRSHAYVLSRPVCTTRWLRTSVSQVFQCTNVTFSLSCCPRHLTPHQGRQAIGRGCPPARILWSRQFSSLAVFDRVSGSLQVGTQRPLQLITN